MMDNVLVWARSQLEGYQTSRDIYKIAYLVEETLIVFWQIAEGKKIHFETELDEELEVVIDPNLVRIALRNIINNAIKYTPDGGRIRLYEERDDGDLLICIADNGIGMDQETLARLQAGENLVSEKGTSGEPGSGLGLTLTKEMLRLNGSELLIESEAGVGTTMKIQMEIASRDPQDSPVSLGLKEKE